MLSITIVTLDTPTAILSLSIGYSPNRVNLQLYKLTFNS